MHELGHLSNLANNSNDPNYSPCNDDVPGATVMNGFCNPNDYNYPDPDNMPTSIQPCDNQKVMTANCPDADGDGDTTCEGDPDDNNPNVNNYCNEYTDNDGDGLRCTQDCNDADPTIPYPASAYCGYHEEWDESLCQCMWTWTPIVVDTTGNGFNLTDAAGGVDFDLDGDGQREHLSWTAANSHDAWLTLDRNGNGSIDDGGELFGNHTPQPDPPAGVKRNGFLALAEFDKTMNGGNGDGLINKQDAVFDRLWLWKDTNHNGVSEGSELHTLEQLGLKSIDLDYKESKKTDQYGNRFKYRAKVQDVHGQQFSVKSSEKTS